MQIPTCHAGCIVTVFTKTGMLLLLLLKHQTNVCRFVMHAWFTWISVRYIALFVLWILAFFSPLDLCIYIKNNSFGRHFYQKATHNWGTALKLMISSHEHRASINTLPTWTSWWWKQMNPSLQESTHYRLALMLWGGQRTQVNTQNGYWQYLKWASSNSSRLLKRVKETQMKIKQRKDRYTHIYIYISGNT